MYIKSALFVSHYRLAEYVDEIDLILGGHDHVYEKKMVRSIIDAYCIQAQSVRVTLVAVTQFRAIWLK